MPANDKKTVGAELAREEALESANALNKSVTFFLKVREQAASSNLTIIGKLAPNRWNPLSIVNPIDLSPSEISQ